MQKVDEMSWSITIGNVAGTAVRIHLTFLLLLAWIGISAAFRGGSDAALSSLLFILLLFLCVLLHEFGHIFMARRFGIPTPEVTLLPIGGVASLERMPEKPMEQLLVALAGPAVNVVIALLLLMFLGFSVDSSTMARGLASIDDPGLGLLAKLAAANIFLVVFNMIPAFPMDGGRVLNAILAMNMDKRKAMQISARIGQGLALVLGFLGLFGNPLLIFIAIFVYMAAAGEAAQSDMEAVTSTLDVRDAMESRIVTLPLDATIANAVDALLATPQVEFPIIDSFGKPVGLLTRDSLIAALKDQQDGAGVMEIAQTPVPAVRMNDRLDYGLKEMSRLGASAIAVVDHEGRIAGLLTMQNIAEMMMIRAAKPEWTFARRSS
jgi:Zn-dependent protease/predicted transcriptional regulator